MKNRVRVEFRDHIADVMLDRAGKFNALDVAMFAALAEAADRVAAESSVRVVILHGAGENFCAGIDLDVLKDGDVDFTKELVTPRAPSPANLFQRAAYAWREVPVPVIAALQGITFGGGFQIAMGADIRYAAEDLKMSIMESKWGLIPDMAISTTLRGILAPDRIKELSWSARIIDAAEAVELGLVTAVSDDPMAAAQAMAKECASRSPDAVRGLKKLVNESWFLPEAESLALEASIQSGIMGEANQLEAVRANLQKRVPEFRD